MMKNKKVIIGLSSILLLSGSIMLFKVLNNRSDNGEVTESVALLSTLKDSSLQVEETTISEEVNTTQINQIEESQNNSEQRQNVSHKSIPDKVEKKSEQNKSVPKIDSPKTNQVTNETKNQSKADNISDDTMYVNGVKGTKNNDGSTTYNVKMITKENTKQAHPDEWYIERQAKDAQGRRVPVFKTMEEAIDYAVKNVKNWHGASGWAVYTVATENYAKIGYYPYFHSFE